MADEIARVASHAITVTPPSPRALPAGEYAKVLISHGVNATPSDSIIDGVAKAIGMAKEERKAVVCLGSLYLYREVNEAIKRV